MIEIFKKINKKLLTNNTTGCWEWQGGKNKGGYGCVSVDKKTLLLHRVMYEIYNGKFDYSLDVLHSCDNKKCCNPMHLRTGTHQENMRDVALRDRAFRPQGIKSGMAKLTEEQAREIKYGNDTASNLSLRYKISTSQIYGIRSNKFWQHI